MTTYKEVDFDSFVMGVASQIDRAIYANGLSYQEVADRAGVSKTTVYNMANPPKGYSYSIQSLHKVLTALNMQLSVRRFGSPKITNLIQQRK